MPKRFTVKDFTVIVVPLAEKFHVVKGTKAAPAGTAEAGGVEAESDTFRILAGAGVPNIWILSAFMPLKLLELHMPVTCPLIPFCKALNG